MAIDFMWIPPDLGGHRSDPYPGMRLQIYWQEHVRVYLQGGMDVECQLLGYDSSTSRGKALCTFSPGVAVPAEWLEAGKLVELRMGSGSSQLGGSSEAAVAKLPGGRRPERSA